jgi:YVTN family beta-propeller protein
MKITYITILGFILFISGCNRESVVDSPSTPITASSKKGLYILCEGTTVNTSRLSFYDFDTMFYENIFSPGNLGTAPDGLIYDGTNILITEQGNWGGQGKIYRLDTSGKVMNSQITDINPYSLCIANKKIYVTNGPINRVTVCDFNELTALKSINVGVYPQEILAYNNKVFVCNTSVNGIYDSTVFVIDAVTDEVADTIVLHREPSSIVLSNDNKLLIGCYNANGKIFKVDPDTYKKLDSFPVVGGFSRDISIDKNSDDVYFISYSLNIVKLNLVTRQSQTVIYNPSPGINYFYGYIFDSKRKNHYVANARSFTTNGLIHKYDLYGTLLLSITSSIGPRRFLLLDN